MSGQPHGEDGLTDMQRRFVEEYVVDLYPMGAAIRAGYAPNSAKQTAYDLRHSPEYAHVQDAIAVALAQRSMRTQVDADYVVRNLTEVVDRCMQARPVLVRDGKRWVQATQDGKAVWQFDAKGANGALTLLGKHLGMYVDRKEITLPGGTGVLAVPIPPTSEQWAATAVTQQASLVRKPEGNEQ